MEFHFGGRPAILLGVVLLILAGDALSRMPGDSLSANPATRVEKFLEEELEFDRYVFPPGPFPSVQWKRPAEVEGEMGSLPLEVKFYDRSLREVTVAERTGRYGAVVRATAKDGFTIVRFVTLYCCNADLDDYSPNVPVRIRPLEGFGVSGNQWRAYRRNLRAFSFGSLLMLPQHDPDVSIFLAGVSEVDPHGGRTDTPRLRDRKWWIDFKRRQEGESGPPLVPLVRTAPHTAPILSVARRPASSVYDRQGIRRLRAICTAWSDSTREPMSVLIVHDGAVAFQGSFGKGGDGNPVTPSTTTWMASITKLLTGILVMQFVDDGILDLDAPLNRYLHELPSPCSLTLRQLLTHTSGLSRAGEWASDWNPSLENEVAQLLPWIVPGEKFAYTRAGYALAGKILERVSGETVPALFNRLLFRPLGMTTAFSDNTYGGLYCTATDLARLGMMLINHGRYGHGVVLSEKAWRDLLPQPLRFGGIDLGKSWGIGTAPLTGFGFNDSTFGHEAASGAIFRVDPVRHLIVVVGRNSVGPDYAVYKEHASRFLRAVTLPWEKE